MRTIHKYTLELDWLEKELPENCKFLRADFQNDVLCVWAEVDTEACYVRRAFRVFGTGHRMEPDADYQYISTVFTGPLVFHVYVEQTP